MRIYETTIVYAFGILTLALIALILYAFIVPLTEYANERFTLPFQLP